MYSREATYTAVIENIMAGKKRSLENFLNITLSIACLVCSLDLSVCRSLYNFRRKARSLLIQIS